MSQITQTITTTKQHKTPKQPLKQTTKNNPNTPQQRSMQITLPNPHQLAHNNEKKKTQPPQKGAIITYQSQRWWG